jgi:hypothetical protein
VYFAAFAIYAVLSIVFIVDVVRQPATALSGVGKALWIAALLLTPILAWIVYGFWRIQRSRL